MRVCIEATVLYARRGREVRGTLRGTEWRFLFGVCVYPDSSGSDGKSREEVTTDNTTDQKPEKTKLTTAPGQLRN